MAGQNSVVARGCARRSARPQPYPAVCLINPDIQTHYLSAPLPRSGAGVGGFEGGEGVGEVGAEGVGGGFPGVTVEASGDVERHFAARRAVEQAAAFSGLGRQAT